MSQKYSLNSEDLLHVGKLVLFSAVVAGLTTLVQLAPQFDFGMFSGAIVVGLTGVVALIKQFLTGDSSETQVNVQPQPEPSVDSGIVMPTESAPAGDSV